MSASQQRTQLERKRKQRVDADTKANEYIAKESKKRGEASKAREAAAKTSNATVRKNKLKNADDKEKAAVAAGKEASKWLKKASDYAKAEVTLQKNLARSERAEADAAERRRKREQQLVERERAAEREVLTQRISDTRSAVEQVRRELPEPKPEKLRVLLLGASSEGDLRVGREQRRIQIAVQSALHREQIEIEARPAATAGDLLESIGRFRPHVVHFSGHSNEDVLVFEEDRDEPHHGVAVSARAFASAIQATDDKPLLVILNSCKSAAQINSLVEEATPFAIGMMESVQDGDAINYAAAFYTSTANGQSIRSSHLAGQAALEITGLEGDELPTLVWASDVDPATTILVKPT